MKTIFVLKNFQDIDMKSLTLQQLVAENRQHNCPPNTFGNVCVKIVATAKLPTRFGDFQIVAFENNKDHKEHTAIIKGQVLGKENVPVRMHSECLTGDALGSLRCDCRDQLTSALELIEKEGEGVVLYLRQEGRGIGFINKIKAYALQDHGYDTVEADKLLGFSGDEREYDIAAHMLRSLKIKSAKLITNNPNKIEQLTRHGVKVTDRIPHIMPPNKYNQKYLETKQAKAGHLLGLDDMESERVLEQNEQSVPTASNRLNPI
jgi:GTP cyclohydrolase II